MGSGASSRKGKAGDEFDESDAVLLLLAKHVESGGLVNGTTKVWDLLASLSIEELPSNQEELVCLDAEASAAASLGMMLEKGVSSAPVVGGVLAGAEAAAGAPLGAAGEAGVPAVASGAEDATGTAEPAEAAAAGVAGVSGEGGGPQTISGVVDMADLVSAVVAWSEQDDGGGQVPDGGLELSSIVSCDTSTLMALSSTEKNFQIMDPGATIQEAVGLLRDGEVAKVYILDTDGLSISKFITLATLCRFLLKLVQHTDLPADRTLKQMSIGLKPALCSEDTSSMLKALRMMRQHSTSEVAVIDSNDKLCGSVSTSDIALLAIQNDFSPVTRPIKDFIGSKSATVGPDGAAPAMCQCCKVSDTVEVILGKFLGGSSGKVYVVNDDHIPLGELQMSDIVRPLLDSALWLKQDSLDKMQALGS